MPGADIATSWGIFGVTIAILLGGFKWCVAELGRRQATIDRKDATIEQMLPLVTEVSQSMATMNERSAALLDVVVSRAREG